VVSRGCRVLEDERLLMGIVDVGGVEDVLLRERSCRVEETERPSCGGKMLSSSEGSSSVSGKDEVPLTSAIEGCDNQGLRREQEKKVRFETHLRRDLWSVGWIRLLSCQS